MTEVGAEPEVLVLTKGLGLGGAERLLVEQVTDPARSSRFSIAYVRRDKDHFRARAVEDGVPVTCLSTGHRLWPVELARLLRHRRPAVVHSHSPLPASVARLLVRLGFAGAGTVLVYTEHNRWSAYRWPTRVVNAATMALDDLVWTVSDEARRSIWPEWLRRRAITLHHGIDLADERARATVAPDPPLALQQGTITFVHVGNRRPEKAHDVLLAAFALAAADRPDLRLWLIGQHLDDPILQDLLATHPARHRIDVLGYRQDVPALLAAADAMVLSSDHEGLPVAIMEALALGKPVISTSVGGVPEAIRHEREALLVARRDPGALAEALLRFADDPHLRARLASGAAARAALFDASRARMEQERAYRELCRRTG